MPLGHLFGHSPNLPISLTVSYLAFPNLSHTHTPAFWAKRLWSLGRIRVGHLEHYFSVLLNSCRVWWWNYICFEFLCDFRGLVTHLGLSTSKLVILIACLRWDENNLRLPTSTSLWGARGCLSESHLWIFPPCRIAVTLYWHFEVWLHHRIVSY